MASITDLLAQINAIDFSGNADARIRLINAAQAMIARIETPGEFVQKILFQEPSLMACLKIADDIDLFRHVGTPVSPSRDIAGLARATGTQPALLRRLVRHLAACGVLAASAATPGSYGATRLSEALSTREGSSGIRAGFELYLPVFLRMPGYLKEHEYKCPTDVRDTVIQAQQDAAGKTLFECLQAPQSQLLAQDFQLLMQFLTKGRRSFLDVCDVHKLLHRRPALLDATAPLFVDVGGGTGTDALALRQYLSQTPGRVELQDQARVIEAARAARIEEQRVSVRVVDFFGPQPIRNARFYYMSSVLHDWPDDLARRILVNTAAAMRPGYSTLLLSENVLSEAGDHPHLTAMDLVMMTMLASKERGEGEWHQLLGSAGLRIVDVHQIPSCLKSVLECELA